MCGIAGGYSMHMDKSILSKSINAIINRGPDAADVCLINNFGLAHCRLSIIDLSGQSNQPMVSASGRFIIVFNGEIYNYKEVARKYNLKLKTTSDTEVLMEAFELKGLKILDELNGMFAAAFYDKIENSITLVRDRNGKKTIVLFSFRE